MASRFLTGRIRFRTVGSILPHTGTAAPSFPVDLTTDPKLRTAWRGDIRLLGELPWKRDELCPVELEIEAKPFRDYVTSWRPTIFVSRDGRLIGELELSEIPSYSDSEALSATKRSGKT